MNIPGITTTGEVEQQTTTPPSLVPETGFSIFLMEVLQALLTQQNTLPQEQETRAVNDSHLEQGNLARLLVGETINEGNMEVPSAPPSTPIAEKPTGVGAMERAVEAYYVPQILEATVSTNDSTQFTAATPTESSLKDLARISQLQRALTAPNVDDARQSLPNGSDGIQNRSMTLLELGRGVRRAGEHSPLDLLVPRRYGDSLAPDGQSVIAKQKGEARTVQTNTPNMPDVAIPHPPSGIASGSTSAPIPVRENARREQPSEAVANVLELESWREHHPPEAQTAADRSNGAERILTSDEAAGPTPHHRAESFRRSLEMGHENGSTLVERVSGEDRVTDNHVTAHNKTGRDVSGQNGEKRTAEEEKLRDDGNSEQPLQDSRHISTTARIANHDERVADTRMSAAQGGISSPADRPTSAAQTSSTGKPEWSVLVQKLVHEMRLGAGEKSREIVVALKPEHLGHVVLRVARQEERISAALEVGNSQVRAFLEANLGQLQSFIESKGIPLERIEVFSAPFGSTTDSSSPRGGKQSRRQHERPPIVGLHTGVRSLGYNTIELIL